MCVCAVDCGYVTVCVCVCVCEEGMSTVHT